MRYAANDYQVAVPSYKRPDMLCRRTIPFLLNGMVDPGRITVYLHEHDPCLPQYESLLSELPVHRAVTRAHGINAQRAEIRNRYGEGTPLVQCDDDVTELREATTPKTLVKLHDVDGFFQHMFEQTEQRDLYSWGLSPVMNAFFMRPGQFSDGLKFVIFSLFGSYVRHQHPVNETTVATKDDYEYSLRSWWYDGGILRNEHVAAKADIYKAPGGCQDTRTVEQAEASVRSLMEQWPGIVRLNTRRKSAFPEILLNRRARHDGNPVDAPPPGVATQLA